MTEEVKIVIVSGRLYAMRDNGDLLNILVDVYDSPVYGELIVITDGDQKKYKEDNDE